MKKQLVGMSERHLKAAGYKKPSSPFDPWVSPFAADQAAAIDMEAGSRLLLAALWREHPGHMRFASAAGRLVEQP